MARRAATVKKTYNLPPDLIERVKKIFKARTETDAVILALREMTFMEEVGRAIRSTSGKIPGFKPLR
jgi:hypothetical protein